MNFFGVIILSALLLVGLAVACLTSRRLVRLISLGVVVIVAATSSFFLWQFHRWELGFAMIHAGDSRERVHQVMGAPSETTDETVGIYGSRRLASDRVQGCVQQYWYYPFFTPECWWFALDAHGRVIKSNHFISP